MLALSHDLRLMRRDRGYVCLPEVDLGVRFTPGMRSLLTARMSPTAAHRTMILGERLDAPAAQGHGIVDECCDLEALPERAVAEATRLAGRERTALAALKRDLYTEPLAVLGAEDPSPELLAGLTAAIVGAESRSSRR